MQRSIENLLTHTLNLVLLVNSFKRREREKKIHLRTHASLLLLRIQNEAPQILNDYRTAQ